MGASIEAKPVQVPEDPFEAAKLLLGAELVSLRDAGLSARLVEVEVYLGQDDPASHAFRGPTRRTLPMFGPPGTVYVYRSYGIHLCMNVVTGPVGKASAVLLRAAQPLEGIDLMRTRRKLQDKSLLLKGPGRLAQAFGLSIDDSGKSLGTDLGISLAHKDTVGEAEIAWGPRIGISKAAEEPYRAVWLPGIKWASRP